MVLTSWARRLIQQHKDNSSRRPGRQPPYSNKRGAKGLLRTGTICERSTRRRCTEDADSKGGLGMLDDSYRSQTQGQLCKVSHWDFDVFALDKSSKGRPLFHMVMKLFQDHNLIKHFELDILKLMKFADLVEDAYRQNQYHNAIHAADVTQAMHCYLLQEKLAAHLTPLETMVALVSAATHDVDHPGVNQAFLINTSNHLATLYKGTAVLENHHWRTAVGIIHESGVFDHFPKCLLRKFEGQMRDLILATDMARHQDFMDLLQQHNDNGGLDFTQWQNRHFIMQIAMKCADISNPCRTWSLSEQWSARVCDEFFTQGDRERRLTLPLSSHCDRHQTTVPRIQTGFIDFVKPMFEEFNKIMDSEVLNEHITNIAINRDNWQMRWRLKDRQSRVNKINVILSSQGTSSLCPTVCEPVKNSQVVAR